MASRVNQNLFRLDCTRKFWDQIFSVTWLKSAILNQLAFSHFFFSFCRRFRFCLASYSWQVFNTFLYLNFFAWRSSKLFLNRWRRTRWKLWRMRKLVRYKLKKYQKRFFHMQESTFFIKKKKRFINLLRTRLFISKRRKKISGFLLNFFFRSKRSFNLPLHWWLKKNIKTGFVDWQLSDFFLKPFKRLLNNLIVANGIQNKIGSYKNQLFVQNWSDLIFSKIPIIKKKIFNQSSFYLFLYLKGFRQVLHFNKFFFEGYTRFFKKSWYLHLFWQMFLSVNFSKILKIKVYCHVFDILLFWGYHLKQSIQVPFELKIFNGIERRIFKFINFRENFVLKNFIFTFYFSYLTRSLNSIARYLLFLIESWRYKRQGLLFKFLRRVFVARVFEDYLPVLTGKFFPWIYVTFKGRINGKHRARTFVFNRTNSKPSSQNLVREVDFYKFQASTYHGTYGIKLWAYYDKSLVLGKKKISFINDLHL